MSASIIRLFLFAILLGFTGNAMAQVRVKRVRDRFESRRDRKIKIQREQQAPKRRTVNETRIKGATLPEQRNSLDAKFYVKWRAGRKLAFEDFEYNRNLYNKFLPAKDTDLANAIYPDYRDFYKRLSERHKTEQAADDSLWQQRAERLLKNKTTERAENLGLSISIDSAGMMPISIDSPAASVINIQPAIYATGENSYYYNITAVFSKTDSWMIVKSKDILDHEQIHFDIFELYARKMRRHVVETVRSNYEEGTTHEITEEIAPVFEQLYQQLNEMQLEFDRQTAALTSTNSSLVATNAVWKKGLQEQITELKDYAIPEGTITLK